MLFSDTNSFAELVLQEGQKLEASGHPQAAAEKYWLAARFGQIVNSGAHSEYEEWMGSSLQTEAHKRLMAQFERQGKQQEAALMSYLIDQFGRAEEKRQARFHRFFTGHDIASRDAAVVRGSGMMIVAFGGLLVILASAVLARRLQRQPVSPRANQLISRVGFSTALGLLLSAVRLFATYRPYRNILDQIIRTGDERQVSELTSFLMRPHSLPGTWGTKLNFTVDFWAAVTWICAISLVVVLLPRALRFVRSRSAS